MKKWGRSLYTLFCTALGLLVCFPILYCVTGAFKTPTELASAEFRLLPASFLNTENFNQVLKSFPVGRYTLNSFITSVITATVRMMIVLPAAYAFAFFEFRGKRFLFFFLIATMMMPAETLTVANYRTAAHLGLTDTYLGICIVSLVGASQLLLVRHAFEKVPLSLKDAAVIDGCGDMQYLFYVLFPLCLPLLSTLFVQCFVNSWNSYLWPLMVTNRDSMRTLQIGLARITSLDGTNYHMILAGVTLSLIPSMVLFVFLRNTFTGITGDKAIIG